MQEATAAEPMCQACNHTPVLPPTRPWLALRNTNTTGKTTKNMSYRVSFPINMKKRVISYIRNELLNVTDDPSNGTKAGNIFDHMNNKKGITLYHNFLKSLPLAKKSALHANASRIRGSIMAGKRWQLQPRGTLKNL